MDRIPRLIQGNQAIAAGAIYAGARFFAGYPITPSSEVAEECSKKLPKLGGIYMQMEDEIASMGAIVGASLAGVKSFTATSGPGFSLMQENLGMATMGEVPCVIIDVQRSGPSTGLATKPAQADLMQIRWGRHGDQAIIALVPASVEECFHLTVEAFNLSEKFRTPVILAADEIVAHMRENFIEPAPGELDIVNRKQPTVVPEQYRPFENSEDMVAPLASYGSKYIFHITSSMCGPEGYSNNNPSNAAWKIENLHRKFDKHRNEIVKTRSFDLDEQEIDILILAFGGTTRAARAAALQLRQEGVKAGVLQLITIWPFADAEIIKYASKARKIVVPEMNFSGHIADEVRRVLSSSANILKVNKYNGQIITPQDIIQVIKQNKEEV